MSQSLREQLVQAGLASEEQARDRRRGKPKGARKKKSRRRGGGADAPAGHGRPAPAEADATAASKADKRQRRREAAAAVAAIVAEHGRKRGSGEVPYRFRRGSQVKETWVSRDEQRALANGELALIGSQGRYALVPASQVSAIRAANPGAVLAFVEGAERPADEEYGPPVPDDLSW